MFSVYVHVFSVYVYIVNVYVHVFSGCVHLFQCLRPKEPPINLFSASATLATVVSHEGIFLQMSYTHTHTDALRYTCVFPTLDARNNREELEEGQKDRNEMNNVQTVKKQRWKWRRRGGRKRRTNDVTG